MKIFILCQGEGSRWNEVSLESPEFKQMILINENPNLLRTVGMIKKRNLDYTVIGRGEMLSLEQHEMTQNHFVTLQWSGNTILEGIRQLLSMDDAILFVLGDVVFSSKMFARMIYKCTRPNNYTHFMGRMGGNVVTGKQASEIFSFFVPAISQKEIIETTKVFGGIKLWDLKNHLNLPVFEYKGDWTDDVDSPEEYEQFYPALNLAAQNEIPD